MASFELADNRTNKSEGGKEPDRGFTLNPEDNGNYTGGKKGMGVLAGTIEGITAPEIMAYYGRPITSEDVRNFPSSACKQIRKKKYWDKVRGDEIKSQEIAARFYDEEINAGTEAIRQQQEIAGMEQDGKITTQLINFINQFSA